WSVTGGAYLNHLLPLPYTDEALDAVCVGVLRAQERLGRRLLVENPSGYLQFRESSIPEPEFLNTLARRTGCGLLCDVNNVYVTCSNLGGDPLAWLDGLDTGAVAEIHLAGHAVNDADGHSVLIDDHGSAVAEPVWRLFEHALRRFGPTPTLIEWDTDIPTLDVLLGESAKASGRLVKVCNVAAGATSPGPGRDARGRGGERRAKDRRSGSRRVGAVGDLSTPRVHEPHHCAGGNLPGRYAARRQTILRLGGRPLRTRASTGGPVPGGVWR